MDTNLADTYGSFGIDWNFSSGAVEVIGHPGGYGTQPMYDSGFASKNIVDNFISISNSRLIREILEVQFSIKIQQAYMLLA